MQAINIFSYTDNIFNDIKFEMISDNTRGSKLRYQIY